MQKTYKIEVSLNNEQISKFNQTIGVSRTVYGLFIDKNKELYELSKETGEKNYMSAYDFSKWLNNDYLFNNPDKMWIKDVSTKSTMRTISNADKAFRNFFKLAKTKKLKKDEGYPKYKKKGKNDCNMYFCRARIDQPIQYERHKIKIPTLGWIKLKQFGYLPNAPIISGTLKRQAGRYYVSLLFNKQEPSYQRNGGEGIGIDLGLKTFATLSNGKQYETLKHIKLEKSLKRQQRRLSRKYQMNKDKEIAYRNYAKQKLKIQVIYQKISNRREDYLNKVTNDIIKQEPSFITIEDLAVKNMMKNKHLSKAISNQSFGTFVQKILFKCKLNGIELRQVDRFYPSSKTCSHCGQIKKDLKLKDRVYICDCGLEMDRDLNASINLFNSQQYKVIA